MSKTTPSQTVGPFFHFGLTDDYEIDDLAGTQAEGERIVIEGHVLDGAGEPVPDCMIEIWQANAAGTYDHPEDRQDKPVDLGFRGFGRVGTDPERRSHLRTVRPGPVPARGNSLQAPHIVVQVYARGLLKQLFTRIYLEGEPANDTDPVLHMVEDAAARNSLIARNKGDGHFHWDIVLQGENETQFFDA